MTITLPSPTQLLDTLKSYGKQSALQSISLDGSPNYAVTYDELTSVILNGIIFATEQGLQKGDSIAYLFENTPESLIINLICMVGGFRSCPLDSKRDTEEMITYKLQDIKAKLFFYRGGKEGLISNFPRLPARQEFSISNFKELKKLFTTDTLSKTVTYGDKQDVSLILYTSGTTGLPKGTLLTYANLFYGAYQVKEWFKINQTDVFYVVLPLHHINSTIFSLATLLGGGTLVIKPKYSKTQFFADLAQYGVTMSSIVPTINLDLLEEQDSFKQIKEKLKVKRIQIGSAPVSAEHTTKFYAQYGIRLIQGYGSTETSLRVTGVPVDCRDELYQKLLKENSIGKPLLCNEVIIDPDTGQEKEGEICVQGLNVTQGYLNKPKETSDALHNQMFHTGDIGFYKLIEGEKYYFLKGRKKEIIIKGGVNISPIFVEEKIRKILPPEIRDVVVVGFPHYRLGEEVGAVLVKRNTEYPLRQSFSEASRILNIEDQKLKKIPGLSAYETPAAYVLATDDEVAKTSTGKVQHIKVREEFAERLRLSYSLIATTDDYVYRQILPDDQITLQKAVGLHNPAFPFASVDLQKITERAMNGFVLGCFDMENKLVGVLTGFFGSEQLLRQPNWTKITAGGTFSTGKRTEDIAYLVSVASMNVLAIEKERKVTVTEEQALEYFNSGNDFVMRMHKTPKAGLTEGAHLHHLIKQGNPLDWQSGGYVVALEYPSLKEINSTNIRITKKQIGFGLVEAAIMYAVREQKTKVIALSRFGELYKHYK